MRGLQATLGLPGGVLVVLLVAALTTLASWSGLTGAVDALVEQSAYTLRGPRASSHGTILVAIDEPTVAEWGPAPWPESVWEQMRDRAERDGGRVVLPVASVERMFGGRAQGPAGAESLLPEDERAPVVRSIAVPPDATGAIAYLREATPAACRPGDVVTIDYLGTRDHLPTVSAHDVVAGRLPAGALAGEVMLVGVTHSPTAARLPTPVGWLTEAEIVTHAMATSIDGVCVARRSVVVELGLVLLAALVGTIVGSRLPTVLGVLGVGVVVGLSGALYVGAFVQRWFDLAPTAPMVALVLGMLLSRAHERRAARRALQRMARGLEAGAERERVVTPDSTVAALRDATALYLDGVQSSLLAVIDPHTGSLRLSVIEGADLDEVLEPGRDPRKEPFREAVVARQMVWTTGVMRDPAIKTLIVPAERAGRVVALWLVNYTHDAFSDPMQRSLVERMARWLAESLADEQEPRRPQNLPVLLRDVAEVERVLRRRNARAARGADVAAGLPALLVVASECGEITWMNRAAQLRCKRADVTPEAGLRAVLGSALAIPRSELQPALRRAVALGLEARLVGTAHTGADEEIGYEVLVTMSELSSSERAIVVMAWESGSASAPSGGAGPRPAEGTETFDVRGLLLGALEDVRAKAEGPALRPVCLDFDDPMPRVAGDRALFREAVGMMLGDLLSHGDGSTPLLVTANPVDERVVVAFADSTIPLPSASLEVLLLEVGGGEAGGLAHAVELLRTQGIAVEVQGAAGSGATIQLMIRAADAPEG